MTTNRRMILRKSIIIGIAFLLWALIQNRLYCPNQLYSILFYPFKILYYKVLSILAINSKNSKKKQPRRVAENIAKTSRNQ